MSRTLNFTLLDDGNVLVEFNDVVTKHTMSMPAKAIRNCPFVDRFIESAAKARMLEAPLNSLPNPRGWNDA